MDRKLAGVCVFGLSLVAGVGAVANDLDYPETKKVDHVDTYHGTDVPDPYVWLEEDVRESQRVEDWVESENELTFAYLNSIPERQTILDRLTELWDYEKYSSPSKVADYYVFSRNDGLQNQSVVYIQDSLDAEPRVLMDPNTWSEDGTVSLSGMSFSDDGTYVAFSKSKAGSDWNDWYVMDVASGELLDDHLTWIKWSAAAWTPDGDGFFYTRFPAVDEDEKFQSLNLNASIYYHRVGTAQSRDVLVFQDTDHPDWGFFGQVTEDGRYLVISAFVGTDARNRVWIKDLSEPYAAPAPLIDDFDNEWALLGNDGPIFYFKTDLEAPRGRIISIDSRAGRDSLEEIIAQREQVLQGAGITGNMFVCSYMRDVLPWVRMHHITGEHVRDVEFPGIGAGGGFGGKRTQTETFYTFSSPVQPPTIYRYDMITGKSQKFREADVAFNPADYEVKQVFYSSKDGTRVPMFIAHRKGLELNGENPTLLYGYGGFEISITPYFSVTRLAWMDMGGVYAIANIRGGGEYGKEWHEAGKKLNKQNVFDDFIAGAEYLIDSGYTKPDKLAIMGGSNGGLLVGACLTQRPDLFGAAIPAVGVMDMLKFHTWTAGRYWVDDYGSSEDPEQFKSLLAYSPYHNIEPGVAYPATLVTTADTDDRVVPGHSFKFAARLQECQAGDAPVLIRIQTKAGHGAGKPTKMIIEEYADMWSFLAENLDMSIPMP